MGIQTKNLSTARLLMSMHRFFNVQNVSRIYNPNSDLSWQRIYTSCNTKKIRTSHCRMEEVRR